MNYFQEAIELVDHGAAKTKLIRELHDECLKDKIVKRTFQIEIKNCLENMRSALDYCAHGLYHKFGDKSKTRDVYFPYASLSVSQADFLKRQTIDQRIPGLIRNRPDIATIIESYQHFSHVDNVWLPKALQLTNENKHVQLTPQVIERELTMGLPSGVEIVLKPGCSINARNRITLGSEQLAGRSINADNPLSHPLISNTIKEWTSFDFSNIREPVLPFLDITIEGTRKIAMQLSSLT